MSMTRRGSSSGPTLSDLPPDVHYNILNHFGPVELASYAEVNRSSAALIDNPALWKAVSRRFLDYAPENPSAKSVYQAATSLIHRWWIVTGLFVHGVPVHRRSGFCEVSARGGVELPIIRHKQPTCYVFGGQHEAAAVPVMTPGVRLCFNLNRSGSYPVDGMRLALTHAVENNVDNIPGLADLSLTPTAASPQPEPRLHTDQPLFAAVKVRVNGQTLVSSCSPKNDVFSVTHIHIPSRLLNSERWNAIDIEYDRSSTAAYWLKNVTIMPDVLPPLTEEKEASSLRIGGYVEDLETPTSTSQTTSEPTAESSSPQENRRNTTTNRRPVRRQIDPALKLYLADQQALSRHQKSPVSICTSKPKHMYHHNYFRSPRRSSPSSPRARAGR